VAIKVTETTWHCFAEVYRNRSGLRPES